MKIKMIRQDKGYCEILTELEKISLTIYKPAYKKNGFHYYFYEPKDQEGGLNKSFLIRRIGRSCGFIEVDANDIITNSDFYEDTERDFRMKEILKKHHGEKLIVEGE